MIATAEVLTSLDFTPAGIEAMPHPPGLRESPVSAVALPESCAVPLLGSHDSATILAATSVPAWFGFGYVVAEAGRASGCQ